MYSKRPSNERIKNRIWTHEHDFNGRFKKGQTPWNKGTKGLMPTPWNKGKTGIYSKETIEKIKQARKHQIITEESKTKRSITLKGRIPWNKNLKNCHSEETRLKISSKMKKIRLKSNPMKDRKPSVEHRNKISASLKGKPKSIEHARNVSVSYNKKHLPKAEKIMMNALIRNNIKFIHQAKLFGIPDFFIEPNICVFIDGEYWHRLPRSLERDPIVNKTLETQGYTVLRFWENEVKKDVKKCIAIVKKAVY